MADPTPPQTIGPFFADSLLRDARNVVAGLDVADARIRIEGTVRDGDGSPIDDAMVEVWQADAQGRYQHPLDAGVASPDGSFVGFGRAGTDGSGRYWLETIRPGPVPWPSGGWQAPHLNVQVFARGLLDRLATRVYFEEEPANENDPVLRRVPEERRDTLIARRSGSGEPPTYRFDIVLQGEDETVFFDV